MKDEGQDKKVFYVIRSRWRIVRVEETPGTPRRILKSKTKIDATKPCVLIRGAASYVSGAYSTTANLERAHVFDDLENALCFINSQLMRQPNTPLRVMNVFTETTAPVITETVLQ